MWIRNELAGHDPWYAWNWGRQRARDQLAKRSPDAAGDCAQAGRYDIPTTR